MDNLRFDVAGLKQLTSKHLWRIETSLLKTEVGAMSHFWDIGKIIQTASGDFCEVPGGGRVNHLRQHGQREL